MRTEADTMYQAGPEAAEDYWRARRTHTEGCEAGCDGAGVREARDRLRLASAVVSAGEQLAEPGAVGERQDRAPDGAIVRTTVAEGTATVEVLRRARVVWRSESLPVAEALNLRARVLSRPHEYRDGVVVKIADGGKWADWSETSRVWAVEMSGHPLRIGGEPHGWLAVDAGGHGHVVGASNRLYVGHPFCPCAES